MIDFEEELKKFKPSLEVEEAEDAIYDRDLTDIHFIIHKSQKISRRYIGLVKSQTLPQSFRRSAAIPGMRGTDAEVLADVFVQKAGQTHNAYRCCLASLKISCIISVISVKSLSYIASSASSTSRLGLNFLRFYKANIPARNLLGLVYYEMGEVVDALSEWVISRSLQPEDNPAEQYLEAIQSNRSRLSSVNQTIITSFPLWYDAVVSFLRCVLFSDEDPFCRYWSTSCKYLSVVILLVSILTAACSSRFASSYFFSCKLEANNELTSRTQEIKGLEQEIEKLNKKIKQMEGKSDDSQKIINNYEQLLTVYDAFAQDNHDRHHRRSILEIRRLDNHIISTLVRCGCLFFAMRSAGSAGQGDV